MDLNWINLSLCILGFFRVICVLHEVVSDYFATFSDEFSKFSSVHYGRGKLNRVRNVKVHVAELIAEEVD